MLRSTINTKLLVLRLLTVVSIISLLMSSSASALPGSEVESIHKDSVHYLEFDGNVAQGQCSESNIVLTGSNNTAKAFNYLIDQGFTPHQAAGITGNLLGESGLMPNRKQGAGIQTISSVKEIVPNVGFGIAQWTPVTRQQAWIEFAEKKGEDALSLELQLQFLMDELKTNSGYGLKEIKEAGDVRQATWIFLAFFEIPGSVLDAGKAGDPVQPTSGSAKAALDERAGLAQSVLGGGSSNGSTDSPTGGCSSAALTGDESEPDFKANKNVSVDDGPTRAFNEADCTGGFTPGGKSLSALVMDKYSPPVTSVGGYSCRQNTASDTISIHGLGRALDIMIDGTTPKGLETGNRIRNFMINNSSALGIQRVIWDSHIWSADQDGWRPYTGPNAHIDHLHVEINEDAGRNPNLAGAAKE